MDTSLFMRPGARLGDLIEFEGPILSLFKIKDELYLFFWADNTEEFNSWLVWKAPAFTLYQYLKGSIGLRQLILHDKNEPIYLIDIPVDFKYIIRETYLNAEVPETYLPEKESFYRIELNDEKTAQDFIENYEKLNSDKNDNRSVATKINSSKDDDNKITYSLYKIL